MLGERKKGQCRKFFKELRNLLYQRVASEHRAHARQNNFRLLLYYKEKLCTRKILYLEMKTKSSLNIKDLSQKTLN